MTVEAFKDFLHCKPFAETNRFQASNWYFEDQELFHERFYVRAFCKRSEPTPAQSYFRANEKTHIVYWAGHFENKNDAIKAAKTYNAEISEEFYGDGYFLIFLEFDDVALFCFDSLNNQNN